MYEVRQGDLTVEVPGKETAAAVQDGFDVGYLTVCGDCKGVLHDGDFGSSFIAERLEAEGVPVGVVEVSRLEPYSGIVILENYCPLCETTISETAAISSEVDPETADSALAYLSKLTKLRKLNLRGSVVSRAGLAHLMHMPRLRTLCLDGAAITDGDLMSFREVTWLTSLDLSHTSITDAGLMHLGELTKLQVLNLSGTRVTDAELVHLESLTNLKVLMVFDTKVTEAGIAQLKGLTKLGEPLIDEAVSEGYPRTIE